MPPALDHAITLPSWSVIVMCVLLNEAWMCTNPWCTTRFSPRFLNVLRGAFLPSPWLAASVLAISLYCLNGLLLGDGALARALARPRVGARPLAAHRKIAAMPQAAIAADFHQPLDVHRDLLAEVAFDATHFLDHAADLADIVFRQVLDPDVRADAGGAENVVRSLAADSVNVGEADLDALRARQIDACNACHLLSLPLLVLGVRADYPHHPAAADDLALVADLLY